MLAWNGSRLRWLTVAIALSLSACTEPRDTFPCTIDADCEGLDPGGRCERTGFCSFLDGSCPTGRRFGALSAAWSDACVPATSSGGGNDAGDCVAAPTYTSLIDPSAYAMNDLILYAVLEDRGGTFVDLVLFLIGFEGELAGVYPHPGTFDLAKQAPFASCGVCASLTAQTPRPGGILQQHLFLRSGRVVLDSITPSLRGTLTDLHFQQYDPQTLAFLPGGCETRIPLASFSAPLQGQDPPSKSP